MKAVIALLPDDPVITRPAFGGVIPIMTAEVVIIRTAIEAVVAKAAIDDVLPLVTG